MNARSITSRFIAAALAGLLVLQFVPPPLLVVGRAGESSLRCMGHGDSLKCPHHDAGRAQGMHEQTAHAGHGDEPTTHGDGESDESAFTCGCMTHTGGVWSVSSLDKIVAEAESGGVPVLDIRDRVSDIRLRARSRTDAPPVPPPPSLLSS